MATSADASLLLAIRQASDATNTATPTPAIINSNNNNTGVQAPSLFFIALGIGVIFTNLWLIIGIKYCCRRRRSRLEVTEPDGDRTNEELHTLSFYGAGVFIPTTVPRRRRREKKLLTIEQLDDMFPIQKYSQWCELREKHGLPVEGGISEAAAHVAAHVMSTTASPSRSPTTDELNTSPLHEADTGEDKKNTLAIIESQSSSKASPVASNDKHCPIQLKEMFGDLCAICIDSLEPNNDVRSLSCHHVFHSDCVTPWLTTRRAICPLCKADYYVSHGSNSSSGDTTQGSQIRQPSPMRPSSITNRQLDQPWRSIFSPRVQPPTEEPSIPRPARSYWPFSRRQSAPSTPNTTRTIPDLFASPTSDLASSEPISLPLSTLESSTNLATIPENTNTPPVPDSNDQPRNWFRRPSTRSVPNELRSPV